MSSPAGWWFRTSEVPLYALSGIAWSGNGAWGRVGVLIKVSSKPLGFQAKVRVQLAQKAALSVMNARLTRFGHGFLRMNKSLLSKCLKDQASSFLGPQYID